MTKLDICSPWIPDSPFQSLLSLAIQKEMSKILKQSKEHVFRFYLHMFIPVSGFFIVLIVQEMIHMKSHLSQ